MANDMDRQSDKPECAFISIYYAADYLESEVVLSIQDQTFNLSQIFSAASIQTLQTDKGSSLNIFFRPCSFAEQLVRT